MPTTTRFVITALVSSLVCTGATILLWPFFSGAAVTAISVGLGMSIMKLLDDRLAHRSPAYPSALGIGIVSGTTVMLMSRWLAG